MNKVRVEGSLNYDDGSSSDSEPEPDEPDRPPSPPLVLHLDGGDDEEVEYFGDKKITLPIAQNVAKPPEPASTVTVHEGNTASESRLASILGGNIDAFESGGNSAFSEPASKPPAADAPPAATAVDEFGIAYQSKHRPANNNAVAVTALDDFDTEIEDRLLHARPAATTVVDDDDEFDLDGDGAAATSDVETIRRAIESAGLSTANEEKTAPIVTPASTIPNDIDIIAKPEVSAEKVTAQSILAEARKAFTEVSEVYGSGLGDQEVLIGFAADADDANANNKKSKDLSSLAALRRIDVIEEGDESAAEEEDAQEEVREAELISADRAEKAKLESEWDGLESGADGGAGGAGGAGAVKGADGGPAVVHWSFTKAVRYFKQLDYSAVQGNITVREEGKGGGWFSAAPKPIAYPNSEADLELPFLIAQVDYDPQCVEHWQMLSTIYAYFVDKQPITGSTPSTASGAKNWERLGFQGNDPRTDLNRSMKMLSVVQVLSFLEQDPTMARRVFDLSQSAVDVLSGSLSVAERNARAKGDTSWPFMCVGIMFTKEALQALRRGVLNDKCNKRSTVFGVLNEFHRACFAEFESLLREQPSVHHAVHLATLRQTCESHPLKLLRKYKAAQQKTPASMPPGVSADKAGDDDFRFDNLESVEATQEAETETAGGEKKGSGRSGWTSLFGGDRRASKFTVS